MADIAGAFVASLGVSLLSLIGVLTFVIQKEKLARFLFIFVALAIGALLGNAFFHLLPEAYDSLSNHTLVGTFVLLGMLILFLIERFLHWHHTHNEKPEECASASEEHQKHHVGIKIALADGFHNFIDGVIIAIAFLEGPHIGLATTLAVILHEIPQEISDTAILLHAGYSRNAAILVNFASAFMAVLGVAVVALFGTFFTSFIPFAVALTAGGFIYIALKDLVPAIASKPLKTTLALLSLSAIGALGMAVFVGA